MASTPHIISILKQEHFLGSGLYDVNHENSDMDQDAAHKSAFPSFPRAAALFPAPLAPTKPALYLFARGPARARAALGRKSCFNSFPCLRPGRPVPATELAG